jgi:hypothetical protein
MAKESFTRLYLEMIFRFLANADNHVVFNLIFIGNRSRWMQLQRFHNSPLPV